MGNEAKVLRTRTNHETAILGELMESDRGVEVVATCAASIAEAHASRDYTMEGKRNASLRALQAARAALCEHEAEHESRQAQADGIRGEILSEYGVDRVNSDDIREARQLVHYGLKDATRHAWGDNSVRLTAALGRTPTEDELADGLQRSRAASESQLAPPAVDRDLVILRAALRANVRATSEQDILTCAGQAFSNRAPTVEVADTFFAGLRGEAPHLFVPSVGAGAAGSGSFAPNSSLDRTPYLSPEEAGKNAERIAQGLPVW